MRKPTIANLKKKLDKVFAVWVKERDRWRCITCGKISRDPMKMNAGHFVSRRHHSLRWDGRNVHAQCAGCNNFRHGELDVYAIRLQEKYGPQILIELNRLKHKIKRYTRQELEDLIQKYK